MANRNDIGPTERVNVALVVGRDAALDILGRAVRVTRSAEVGDLIAIFQAGATALGEPVGFLGDPEPVEVLTSKPPLSRLTRQRTPLETPYNQERALLDVINVTKRVRRGAGVGRLDPDVAAGEDCRPGRPNWCRKRLPSSSIVLGLIRADSGTVSIDGWTPSAPAPAFASRPQ